MRLWIWLTFWVFTVNSFVRAVIPESASATEKAQLRNITDRVFSGEYGALMDAASLPAPIAIPYLYDWTRYRGGDSPEKYEAANEALRNVQGYAEYLRDDMAKVVAQGGIPGPDFDILEAIGTPEAAAVVAPYLFETRLITVEEGARPDSIAGWAMTTLERMNIPNAPKESPQIPGSETFVAWEKWAIAKGYVPKDWSSRVGAPAWLLIGENPRPVATPVITQDPSSPRSPLGPQPAPVPPPAPQPSTTPEPSKEAPSKDNWRGMIPSAVVLAIVIISGVCLFRKRKAS